jgi:hypothetical protein
VKTGLGPLLALIALALLAAASHAFIDPGRMPARDPDLIDLHRSIHVYAGHCADCRNASYQRHYYCRGSLQCLELDRGAQIDGFDSTTRRAVRRPSLTENRRIKCVSEHS